MSNDDIKRDLRQFINTEISPGASFADDEDLLGDVIDSMAMTKLVDFIEKKLAVALPAEALEDPDNFATLDALTATVARARAGAAG